MNPSLLPLLLTLISTASLLRAQPNPISNITVIGAVFCDTCYINSFSNHSYFLPGASVHVECKFRANSTSNEDITITADRTTDQHGIYKLDIPPVDGFECREGRDIESFCRASLVGSSSALCNVSGLASSTEHVAVKCGKGSSICAFMLNALNFRPPKRYDGVCGAKKSIEQELSSSSPGSFNNSLFFWPPFWFPWPYPFPSPPTLPIRFPPIPFFTPPPAFPFPLPPIPFFSPSPPPPAFPFPLPPLPPLPQLPQFPPLPPVGLVPLPPVGLVPPLLASPPPPPPPPPPFLFPFPPLPPLFPPLFPAPGHPPPPPPPAFSLRDPRTWFPRTWFPFFPPSAAEEEHDQKP